MASPKSNGPEASSSPHGLTQSERERNLSLGVLSGKLKKNYPFFAGLKEDELLAFLRMCDRQVYKNGGIIFEEGEREDFWFIILTGGVSIYRGDKELGRLEEGQCFGEVGLLKDAPRSACARALGPTLLLGVRRNILSENAPALGYKVLEYIANQLADKLMKANIRIENPRLDAPPAGEDPAPAKPARA